MQAASSLDLARTSAAFDSWRATVAGAPKMYIPKHCSLLRALKLTL